MGLRSNLNLSEPIVIHWLDARCFAVTERASRVVPAWGDQVA